MSFSLIPERPILVSPSLAATIGLEEATLLSVLDEYTTPLNPLIKQGLSWFELDGETLAGLLPFWNDLDIQRVSQSLRAKGILLLESAPFTQSQNLTFAVNETSTSTANSRSEEKPIPSAYQERFDHAPVALGATLIAPGWQPGAETVARIRQHNIPEQFIHQQVPEFITFWRENGEAHRSWGSKFHQHVIHQWRQRETFVTRKDQETAMTNQWRPSLDAIEVLTRHAGINPRFVEDAIPEFALYWGERGQKSRTWNSKFIQHVRRQWSHYNSALEHDTEPRRITEDWQPGQDVLDVIQMANIDTEFALQLVAEFVLYWRDSNRLHNSWNTKFLQHVKYHWAKRHAFNTSEGQNNEGQQTHSQPGRTRDRSLEDDLSDRSWAN